MDCLSPMVPAGVMRVGILSAAGVLRALCGVAGGSSKASLSAHFAKWGNLAELNAVSFIIGFPRLFLTQSQKDSSQETVISLIGMLVRFLYYSGSDLDLTTITGRFSSCLSRHRIQDNVGSTAGALSGTPQP